jgi:glutaminase
MQTVRRYGERIRVMELQGPLVFSTFEPVVRTLVKQAPYCRHVILTFRHVVSADAVSLRMLKEVRDQLIKIGVNLLCCQPGKLARQLLAAEIPEDSVFDNEDAALEACEDNLLGEVMHEPWREPQPVPLDRCPLFRGCDTEDLALLHELMPLHQFALGATIITSGTHADELFILVTGSVEVCLPQDGRRGRQRLDVFDAGMSFGEMAFLDNSFRSADVVAMELVECRVMTREVFETLDQQRPGLKIKILTQLALQLSGRLRQANIEISALRS